MINEISFSEAYDIILHMDKELVKKIPEKFIKFVEQNKAKDYKTNIDYSKSINQQELQKGTRVILSIIYRDYLCSSEKKKELMQNDEEELKRIEQELREKYNPDNLFKMKNNNSYFEEKQENCLQIIEYKENFFVRIIKKIKNIYEKIRRNKQ